MQVRKRTSKIIKPINIYKTIIIIILNIILIIVLLQNIMGTFIVFAIILLSPIIYIIKVLEHQQKCHKKIYPSIKEIHITKEKEVTKNLLNNQNYMPKMYYVGNYVRNSRKKESMALIAIVVYVSSIIINFFSFPIMLIYLFLLIFLGIQYSKRYDKGYIRTSYKKDEIMKVEKMDLEILKKIYNL